MIYPGSQTCLALTCGFAIFIRNCVLLGSLVFVSSMRSAVITNVRQTPNNAVFFPSAQMKNKRYKPSIPTEMRTTSARTQSTQTPHRSGDYRSHRISDTYIGINRGSLCDPAPARREADAPSRCIIRIPDKRPKKPEAAAPIPVQKQDIGHTSDTIPAPSRCIYRARDKSRYYPRSGKAAHTGSRTTVRERGLPGQVPSVRLLRAPPQQQRTQPPPSTR